MKRFFKWFGGILLVLLLVASAVFVNFWYFKPVKLDWYYNRVFAKFALQNPEMLTSMRMLEPIGIRGHNAKLGDTGPQSNIEQLQQWQDEYQVFKRYDREDYEGQKLLSYDVFNYFMGTQVNNEDWIWHGFPVNQMFGVQSSLPNFMAQQHVVEDRTDAEHYIARLRLFPRQFDGVIEGLQLREDNGIVPPRFAVEKVIDQIDGFVGDPASENMLFTSFREKLDEIPDESLAAIEKDELEKQVITSIENDIYPAYDKLQTYLRRLLPQVTSNDGVWRLPDGVAFYADQVRQHTTTEMSPEQVHQLGLSEVERIGQEMNTILINEGLIEGNIGERVQQLAKRPDQLYPDSDAGREQILNDYQAILDEIDPAMDQYFNLRPDTGVEVKRVPEFSEETAPGAYYQGPSLDGKRKGVFFANLRNVEEIPRFGMRTLAYHEGIPGHHFQIAITQKLEGLPMFRRMVPFTAYNEGWALYSEQLAWELGYQDDPLDNLGRLQAEMFRAVRLVVDTGLHYKRWSRERAIEYMMAHTGMGEDEVVAEIERYLVNPGQALAYKVGMIKILELRERAKTILGDRFDIKAFHDQVLGNGALPLTLLERVVDDWVAETRANT